VPVGSASYPVPAGSLFVDGAQGIDSASGTSAAPLRSIAAAVTKASSGRTIVVRAGVYHESVSVPVGKALTIQAYPHEAVWLDGSRPVTSWRQAGSVWVSDNWTAAFDDSASFGTGVDYPSMLTAAHPMAAKPDMVFVDGVQLAQVASTGSVTAGAFAVDYTAKTLTIGTNPTGRLVEASDLPLAFSVLSSGNVIQGLGVRRYATPMPTIGTMRIWGGSNTVRNVVLEDNATVGISFIHSNNVADHLTVVRSGMMGIHANEADNLKITNTIVENNNFELFNTTPTASGIKVTRTRGVTIDNVLALNNLATGIWFDESVYNIVLVNSEARGNTGQGFLLELSDTAIVANNSLTGQTRGLFLLDSGNVQVYNNEFGGNSMIAIMLSQDARRQAAPGAVGRDPRAPVPDPTVPWLTRNIVVSNNVFDKSGKFQFYALDKATNIPADAMNLTINGNLFTPRTDTSLPTMVAWGGSDNVTLYRYETPAALAAAKNPAWHNASTTTALTLNAMRSLFAAAAATAVPLPSGVAQALGQPLGTQRVGIIP
jgi:parallel beta-helix repeat protein